MAKFCNNCGAQLSDEMIFCNKCGARYREAQAVQQTTYTAPPVQPVPSAYATAPAKTAASGNKTWWLIALVLTVAAALIFALAPTVNASTEASYGGQTISEDADEKFFEVLDEDTIDMAKEADIDELPTAKIIGIIALAAGGIGVLLIIVLMAKPNVNPSLGFGAIVAQIAMVAGVAIAVFAFFKDAMEDLAVEFLESQMGGYLSSYDISYDISVGFGTWGWVFLGAGALAILATIKAIKDSKA